jgi:hypothetical protein
VRTRYEFAHTFVTEAGDPRQASRAVLHTLAANLYHMLAQIDPACVRESVLSDADRFWCCQNGAIAFLLALETSMATIGNGWKKATGSAERV